MGVLISNDAKLEQLLDTAEIEHIVHFVLEAEGVTREVEISLSFVGEEEMHGLNRQWRGIDKTTDVLSFECDSAFDEDIPLDEALELGDIILAPRLMLVHGMLHLLGYDHIEDDEAEVMEAREDELLRLLAAARGDDPASIEVGPITRHTHD